MTPEDVSARFPTAACGATRLTWQRRLLSAYRKSRHRIRFLYLGTSLAILFAACGGDSSDTLPSVLLPADTARSPDDYSVAIADEPPPESEPGFDIIGPVWDIRGPGPPDGELLTIELPAPGDLPPDVDPTELKIASFHPAFGDGTAFWVIADDVEHDQQRAVLSTQTGGVGLFAIAVPNGYWTTTLSRDGNYRIHYVSDPASDRAAEPEYVALLRDELEDARRWMVDNGYREPKDTFGGPQPVYLVPLIGGPGLTEPSNLGSVMKLDNQLHRTPGAVPGAVTHELFHLSQRRARFDPQREGTWIREATAEYVAVQRLGISGARPHIDTSCGNYARSVLDTRGINEYQNWTFVAFLEHLHAGFVRRFFESAGGPGDGVGTLRELAGSPLNEVMAQYAGSYRLLQDYFSGGGISCPAPVSVEVQALDGRSYHMPPLAGLVVLADMGTPRRVKLAIEPSGGAEVILWGFFGGVREQLQPTDTGTPGRLVYDLDCAATRTDTANPLVRIALLLGTGEEAAEVELSVEVGEAC